MVNTKPKRIAFPNGKKTAPRYMAAYGSNLNIEQMKRRCPNAVPVEGLYLKGKILRFRGVADMIDRKRNKCPIGIWRITPQCERALDFYEGVEHGLYAKKFFALEVEGQVRPVLHYQMTRGGIMPPGEMYFRSIEQGYRDFGLDDRFLLRALEHSWERKNRTAFLDRRYARAGKPALAQLWEEDYEEENEDGLLAVDEYINDTDMGWAERLDQERDEINEAMKREGIL